jgi:hypothetical protein
MRDYIEQSDVDVATLKSKSKDFVEDNIANPTTMDYLIIESAMLIGALTATAQLERPETPQDRE